MGSARIGIDIGGTFTDLVLLDDSGRTFSSKISSTPARPEEAVLTGVQQIVADAGLAMSDVVEVLHGTTVGSNTLLQKVGAKTGLITTKGFRDVLEIGRVRTPTMFDLGWDKPAPLIARRYRKEVDERVTADGRILRPPKAAEIIEIGRFFRAEGVESVAICFLNSYRNPDNEALAERTFRESFPEIWVTSSTSVLPEIREYERTSTTAVNAYVVPALRGYFSRLEQGLRDIGLSAPLLICNSNGGLSSARLAREKPVFFISSGRSAGVVGAAALGAAAGEANLVAFDMGGTTASASLIHDGRLSRTNEYEFRAGISTSSRFIKAGGYLMRVPTIDVAEVGNGAGSIAVADAGGLLHVGPLSAGAVPGPVCYGTGGTRPTMTDANVVLGFLPSVLAGGAMTLDIESARAAIDRDLARPLGLSVEEAAVGVREVGNINMARAIRAVTVERGVDPRDFTLLAFGGSGPVHACDLARTLGIRRILFPGAPGVFTAMGMLAGSVERYFLRPLPCLLHRLSPAEANGLIADLRREAIEALAQEGYAEDRIVFDFELDLRFRGQDSELPVALPGRVSDGDRDALREAFLAAYKGTYGYASSDDVESVSIRLRASGTVEHALDFAAGRPAADTPKPASVRRVYFDRKRQWVETPVRSRASFAGEARGPLILESPDTTIVIPPDAAVSTDRFANIVVDLDRSESEKATQTSVQDPITFAVIKNALDTIVDDMAYAVMRTARSPIVRDVLDYSVTLCDRKGRILCQAKTVALHLGAVPDAIDVVIRTFGSNVAPGDVIVLNDPYEGGMHLPDIFMFKPIFVGERLQGFSIVIAHHCDVGGRVPGSNASDSTEIFQEGLRIPPMKLYDKGVLNETLIGIIRKNVRLPELVVGDLEAQYATCNIGERELRRLVERYGEEELEGYFDALLDYGEELTRKAIAAWPDGEYSFTDYIDGDGFSPDPIALTCKITVAGEHVYVDFAGSSPQVRGAINSTLSFTKSSTYLSIRCALDRDVPNNAGVYRCITVTAPQGSVLNPVMPAAVAARALTGYRVVDTVLGALAKIVPTKVMAAGEGGNTVVAFGGYDKTTREPFVLVDMINGAWGGRATKDGIEGVTNPSQNMSNLPIETLETRYPLIMEAYGLRQDSCGAGEFRGGLGLVRQYRLLAEEAVLQIRADRHDHPPYGLFGGKPGAPSRNILDPDGAADVLASKITRDIGRDFVVRHEQAGAGGYGDPLKRRLDLIRSDLDNEKISPAYAEANHGVVFIAGSLTIDEAATAARRRQAGARR